MPKDKPEPFESSSELEELAKQILEATDKLEDAKLWEVRYIYTNQKMKDNHASCRKLSDDVRFVTGVDFIIKVEKENFYGLTEEQKLKLFIHELRHVFHSDADVPQPKLRAHAESFCHYANHDRDSQVVLQEVLAKGRIPALASIPHQETL